MTSIVVPLIALWIIASHASPDTLTAYWELAVTLRGIARQLRIQQKVILRCFLTLHFLVRQDSHATTFTSKSHDRQYPSEEPSATFSASSLEPSWSTLPRQ